MSDVVSLNVQKYIDNAKSESIEKLSNYLTIFILLAFPLSLYRTLNTELGEGYIIQHYALFALVAIVISIKRKLSYQQVAAAYIVIGVALLFSEFNEFGILGIGEFAGLFSLIISLFYMSKRVTTTLILIVSMAYLWGMYQFIYQGKTPPMDAAEYMSSPICWLAVFLASVMFFTMAGLSTYGLQRQIIELGVELEKRNKAVEVQRQEIEFLANHDALTGLPSLRVADRRLAHVLETASEKQHQSALLFLDLDSFKSINDTHGHGAGDAVLKCVSERICGVIRSTDTACRIGGDEFLVIVERFENVQDITGLCLRLISVIGQPIHYGKYELNVGVSIGAATYPCSAGDANSLRAKADELMYKVKKSGKNNYQVAFSGMDSFAC